MTLLRVGLGVVLVAHGLLKVLVFGMDGTAGFFASVGFPGWMAWPVMWFEVGAGVLLVLGLFTRWLAALCVPLMLGAAWVHLGNGWVFSNSGGGWEYPVFLALVSAVVALGAGWSPGLKKAA